MNCVIKRDTLKKSRQLFDLQELILKVTYLYRSSMRTSKYFRNRLYYDEDQNYFKDNIYNSQWNCFISFFFLNSKQHTRAIFYWKLSKLENSRNIKQIVKEEKLFIVRVNAGTNKLYVRNQFIGRFIASAFCNCLETMLKFFCYPTTATFFKLNTLLLLSTIVTIFLE